MSLTPSLPQHDPKPQDRAKALADAKALWRPSSTKLPGIVMTAEVPPDSQPSTRWFVEAGKVAGKVALNILSNRRAAAAANSALFFADEEELEDELDHQEQLLDALQQLDADALNPEDEGDAPVQFGVFDFSVRSLTAKVDAQVRGILSGGMSPGLSIFEDNARLYAYGDEVMHRKAGSLADYEALYRNIPGSPAASGMMDDVAFARRRLNGPNGAFLQRVNALPDAFALTDAHYRRAMGEGDSLEAAAKEGRLYLADYTPLATELRPKDPSLKMYAFAPFALFAVPKGGGALRPVGVQAAPKPGPGVDVVTPKDGWRWAMARYAVEVADMAYFEPITHLAFTHLMIEPVALATHRFLAPNHPVHLLLRPHFEGTISVNDSAVYHLLADGGAIDQTFGADMGSIREVAVKAIRAHHFQRDALPQRLADRGLNDKELLPDSPYRDDSMRILGAMERWVSAYVQHAYADDASVQADPELRAWAGALSAGPDQGGLNGFPEVDSRAALAAVLTRVIFTGSAAHAATNFPQWSDCSFAARMSGAAYADQLGADSEADLLTMLPPLNKAELHADFLYLLGGLYHTRLGVYESNVWPYRAWFTDPVVAGQLLPAFQADLARIEAEIKALNADRSKRAAPYEHLLPSRIPQSINI